MRVQHVEFTRYSKGWICEIVLSPIGMRFVKRERCISVVRAHRYWVFAYMLARIRSRRLIQLARLMLADEDSEDGISIKP